MTAPTQEQLDSLSTEQIDICALAHIVKDLTDAVFGLYGFCSNMFDIHWPYSEYYNQGRDCLSYAQERLAEARIFDHYTREWLNGIKKEGDGKGDRE